MLHKRSAESVKSKMPVSSRRILGSAKARSYLSSLECFYSYLCMISLAAAMPSKISPTDLGNTSQFEVELIV